MVAELLVATGAGKLWCTICTHLLANEREMAQIHANLVSLMLSHIHSVDRI